MVLLPIVVAAISPNMYDTWRGLYVVPMYLTGALGVASITRVVNGREGSWRSPSRLAFLGTFAGYVFLAHFSYSLRALWLLILVAVR
jgi:cyanate permease